MCAKPKHKSGFVVVDLIVAVFLLGVCGLALTATFVSGYAMLGQSSEYNLASRVCQDEMEAVRNLGYSSLMAADLSSAGLIDTGQQSSPYSITTVKSLASNLPQGSGVLRITDQSAGLWKITVTVRWQASNGVWRRVTAASLVADRMPWAN